MYPLILVGMLLLGGVVLGHLMGGQPHASKGEGVGRSLSSIPRCAAGSPPIHLGNISLSPPFLPRTIVKRPVIYVTMGTATVAIPPDRNPYLEEIRILAGASASCRRALIYNATPYTDPEEVRGLLLRVAEKALGTSLAGLGRDAALRYNAATRTYVMDAGPYHLEYTWSGGIRMWLRGPSTLGANGTGAGQDILVRRAVKVLRDSGLLFSEDYEASITVAWETMRGGETYGLASVLVWPKLWGIPFSVPFRVVVGGDGRTIVELGGYAYKKLSVVAEAPLLTPWEAAERLAKLIRRGGPGTYWDADNIVFTHMNVTSLNLRYVIVYADHSPLLVPAYFFYGEGDLEPYSHSYVKPFKAKVLAIPLSSEQGG